ncbi:asteroid-like protein [Pseudohyphozyma bogoriensis]|nr:asteroid-like protein [Pseudohyphozyma bogoriensis]
MSSITVRGASVAALETTPLLVKEEKAATPLISAFHQLVLVVLLLATSFAFTAVSLFYLIRQFTCEEYYNSGGIFEGSGDRCARREIEAETARQVTLMVTLGTGCGIFNLVSSTYFLQKLGVRLTMVSQTFWPILRNLSQIYAVHTGGYTGIRIIQFSQLITVLGGPSGYQLAANTYTSYLVSKEERTASFGVIQGAVMLGTGLAFTLGGVVADTLGPAAPFICALTLLIFSTFISQFWLPYVPPTPPASGASSGVIASFLAPLTVFVPRVVGTTAGGRKRHYGVLILGFGGFMGVLATSFVPFMLQLHATNKFDFTPAWNGYLMSTTSLIRAAFLTLVFPRIIAAGRAWYARPSDTTSALEGGVAPEKKKDSHFDLLFLRMSLVVDAVLTGLTTFASTPTHLFIAAGVIPLASGSASASKGVIMEMVPAEDATRALSALALVEMIATVSTVSLFGAIFSALSAIGEASYVFVINSVFESYQEMSHSGLMRTASDQWRARNDRQEIETKLREAIAELKALGTALSSLKASVKSNNLQGEDYLREAAKVVSGVLGSVLKRPGDSMPKDATKAIPRLNALAVGLVKGDRLPSSNPLPEALLHIAQAATQTPDPARILSYVIRCFRALDRFHLHSVTSNERAEQYPTWIQSEAFQLEQICSQYGVNASTSSAEGSRMGVHGFTSWVNKQSSLPTTVVLPLDTPEPRPIPLVLDALAFLYHTALVDTLRGGNYRQYQLTLRRYIEYWRTVGLEPIFVWDGPFGASKLCTVLQRSEQNLAKSISYFRASDEQRATPFFQKLARRLPPLSTLAALDELRQLGVASYFAEEEADSPTAELAQRLNGFVVSNDSDYFIFNASCRGYVPLTAIEYGDNHSTYLPASLWPSSSPTIRLRVYHHQSIARLLSLPPPFLPILAALIGNDHADFAKEFALPGSKGPTFPGQMDAATILRIARALEGFKTMPATTLAEIQEVMSTVLPRLQRRPSDDVNIVTKLSRSALSYALQPVDVPSPSFPLHPLPPDSPATTTSKALYLNAFREGRIGTFTLSILKHGILNTSGSTDNPDFQAPAVTFGKPIRLWIYAILKEAGLLLPPRVSVVEYDRKQDHVTAATVAIPDLANLLSPLSFPNPNLSSILASPVDVRLSLYLDALKWPTTHPTPPPTFLPLVLALRHIQRLSKRPWSPSELGSAVLTAILLQVPSHDLSSLTRGLAPVPPKHFIQKSAELIQTLLHVNILGEVLLLTGGVLPGVHGLFDGALLHTFLGMGVGVQRVVEGLPEAQRGVYEQVMGWVLVR